jgi:hypothetical protein
MRGINRFMQQNNINLEDLFIGRYGGANVVVVPKQVYDKIQL